MNHENLINIAKTANEKGFKPNTLTTKATNDYLLGGKNLLVNNTCIYLWMCEVQMWLSTKRIYIHIFPQIEGYGGIVKYYFQIISEDKERNILRHLLIGYDKTEESYDINNKAYDKKEDSLLCGIRESLKLI